MLVNQSYNWVKDKEVVNSVGNFISEILSWLTSMGYLGIALGLMIEIIPSEIVLAYGGYMVSEGTISFIGAIVAGVIGERSRSALFTGSPVMGTVVLDKYGKYLLLKKHHVDVAENWFRRYGAGVVFSARFIPVVRHAISIPCENASFQVCHIDDACHYSVVCHFRLSRVSARGQWKDVDSYAGMYTTPIIILALVFIVVYFVVKKMRSRL